MGLNLNLGNINKAAKDFTHRRSEASDETMRDVEVEFIKADPQQPRKEFDEKALKHTALSSRLFCALRRTKMASITSLPEKDGSGL